ncbi:MAG: hypothetical protein ICV83_13185 [Cytophagales bacterium]|nr:hypothetical protein [Cytophagales bacterium]
MRYFLIWVAAGLLLAGCKDECFYPKEPALGLLVNGGGKFRRVYSPDGRDVPTRNGQPVLPISLHADSVTYLFDGESRTDTLTIFYTRRFFFESEKCGLVAEIDNSTLERQVRTSFAGAYVVFSEEKWGVRRNAYEAHIYPRP